MQAPSLHSSLRFVPARVVHTLTVYTQKMQRPLCVTSSAALSECTTRTFVDLVAGGC